MSENNGKELYLNFDEYIRQGEPAQQEKAGYWQTPSDSRRWMGCGGLANKNLKRTYNKKQ